MRMSGISDYAAKQIRRNGDVSTEVLTRICGALHCEVQDIVDFLSDINRVDNDVGSIVKQIAASVLHE